MKVGARGLIAIVALVVMGLLWPSGLRSAAGIACSNFAVQEDAQAVLEANGDDRFGLDPDGDGIACEELPTRSGEPPVAGDRPKPTAISSTITYDHPIQNDIDGYWRRRFKKADHPYASPIVVGVRLGTPTPCGPFDGSSTAFYCPPNQGIYYLVEAYADRDDDPYAFADWIVMLAHEWGHHAQRSLGLFEEEGVWDETVQSISLELQAQCLAGAYVGDAQRREVIDARTADEALLIAHRVIGDHAHGSAPLNNDAYERGYAHGATGCGFRFELAP